MPAGGWRWRICLTSVLTERVDPQAVSGLIGESWRLQGADLMCWRAAPAGRKRSWVSICVESSACCAVWLPGAPLDDQAWRHALTVGTLAVTLAILHQPPARYARYWQRSDLARRAPAWLRLQRRFLHRRPPPSRCQALLHMDVHQGNVLQQADGSLVLIDWEYAGDGGVGLELAALFCGNGLPVAARERMLADHVR